MVPLSRRMHCPSEPKFLGMAGSVPAAAGIPGSAHSRFSRFPVVIHFGQGSRFQHFEDKHGVMGSQAASRFGNDIGMREPVFVGNIDESRHQIGSLYDEAGSLVAFKSVFDNYDKIKKEVKAAYASSFTGNPTFRQRVAEWTIGAADVKLAHSVIATPVFHLLKEVIMA